MRSVNRLTVLGNVGSIRAFSGFLKISIATSRSWIEKGHRKEITDWVPVTIVDEDQRRWIEENVEPGDAVYVEARVGQPSSGRGEDRQFAIDVVATAFSKL